MNSVLYAARLVWNYLSDTGPWVVVGTWFDDEGSIRRYIAGGYDFASRSEAGEYRDSRNCGSAYDPLGTVFHVVHSTTFARYN